MIRIDVLLFRAASVARVMLVVLIWSCALPIERACSAADGDGGPTRQALIGAWRLVRIEYSGVHGSLTDPFYQADSVGLLIYDASGWMSVQIAAPHRRAWAIPTSRRAATAADDAALKAAAFDTYYSYCATWTYDQATSVVPHAVKSSLIAGESGLEYTQQVMLEGGRLTFTVRAVNHGVQTVRRKVWERLAAVPGAPEPARGPPP